MVINEVKFISMMVMH